MRGRATYLVAGVAVTLAVAFAAPAVWLGLPVGARTVTGPGTALQTVNRAGKSDRLVVPMTVIRKKPDTSTVKEQPPVKPIMPVKILEGCDPVFSPLSSSAQLNAPGRCAV